MAQLVAGDSRRFPDARAQRTKPGWVVLLDGPAERVAVRGVPRTAAPAGLVLETTPEDAYRSLDEATRIPAAARAAKALAVHARRHPVARFLCHPGLPLWHAGANPCRAESDPAGVTTIDLGQVRLMMAGLRGLEALARHATTGDGPADPARVAAALSWPILPAYLTRPVRAETARDGALVGERCRQIVATSVQVLQDSSRLRHDVEWVTAPRRLQPVTHAHSDLALYVHVFIERLLHLS